MMGRAPKYSEEEMLDAAGRLLVDGGPSALSASAVARALSAPSGSVYHRFPSRDHLAATLWMRTVERFDAEVVGGLAAPGDAVEVAVAVARSVVDWSSANPVDAFILTMFRREDLTQGEVPPELAARARSLGTRQRAAVRRFATRLGQPPELVTFAVAGIPHAAVRRYVGDRKRIPGWVAAAAERAVRGVLTNTP
jgi:AcrR family transcriptional regulator